MTLIDNAVRSIQIGIDDYDDPIRVISSIRNVHAGVLLLFKEKLRRLSPPNSDDALVKQRIIPTKDAAGAIVFVGKGKNTVDIQEIKERFSKLGVQADWTSFDRLATVRNNVEHYYATDPAHVLQEAMVKAFTVANSFIRSELQDDPARLFGMPSWDKLLSLKEVFDKEKAECSALMGQVQWTGEALRWAVDQFQCNQCTSSLLAPVDISVTPPEVTFECRGCAHRMEFAEQAAGFLGDAFWAHSFEAAKDGGDPPLYDCPECGVETFIMEDDRCANCGYEREYDECLICHATLGPDEQEYGGFCAYHADVMSRND